MRDLVILRGLPGCGKSTFVKENGLEAHTISPDSIRLLLGSPELETDGRMAIPQRLSRRAWETMYENMSQRMDNGEFLVIDATHTIGRYFKDYAKLAYEKGYRTHIVDFSDVPIEVCKERNQLREAHKVVPDAVIDKMSQQMSESTKSIGRGYTLHKPQEFLELLKNTPLDLSSYKRVHILGDIQGCYTPLAEYFQKYPYSTDEYYIFVGDLLDRGKENDQVMHFMLDTFMSAENVMLVEGNHEAHLRRWANNKPVYSKEFTGRTQRQLEDAQIDKGQVRQFMMKFVECGLIAFDNKNVLVTHAGISTLPDSLRLIPAKQFTHGVGSYDAVGTINDSFVATTPDNIYQVHGHRNRQSFPTQYNERTFNLEGKVEFGGDLRVIQLENSGFKAVEINNNQTGLPTFPQHAPFIHSLRKNDYVAERYQPGNIVSFNFKTAAFRKKIWNKQTIRARGLFVNNLTNEIVIRSYDKFFNVGERRDTEVHALKESLVFPVDVWVKENGYLGLAGYDSSIGDIIVASKSTTESDFANWTEKLLLKDRANKMNELRTLLEDENICLVFESIMPMADPHIIEYSGNQLVLLEAVKRQPDFEALPFTRLQSIAQQFGFRLKKHAVTLNTADEFEAWIKDIKGLDYSSDGEIIEGFVLEDSNNYRVKVKLDYYAFWKQMRSALDAVNKGKIAKISDFCDYPEEAKQFIDFLKTQEKGTLENLDIISARKLYLQSK